MKTYALFSTSFQESRPWRNAPTRDRGNGPAPIAVARHATWNPRMRPDRAEKAEPRQDRAEIAQSCRLDVCRGRTGRVAYVRYGHGRPVRRRCAANLPRQASYCVVAPSGSPSEASGAWSSEMTPMSLNMEMLVGMCMASNAFATSSTGRSSLIHRSMKATVPPAM